MRHHKMILRERLSAWTILIWVGHYYPTISDLTGETCLPGIPIQMCTIPRPAAQCSSSKQVRVSGSARTTRQRTRRGGAAATRCQTAGGQIPTRTLRHHPVGGGATQQQQQQQWTDHTDQVDYAVVTGCICAAGIILRNFHPATAIDPGMHKQAPISVAWWKFTFNVKFT